jgi:DNA-directed RNA polymerase subunit alpha
MPGPEGFALPNALQMDIATATARYAKFVAEPWENGFGHTIGNALRRVLLSSMDGVAVASVRIDGVAHEFSTIPGVVEDVTEVILNIKKLRLNCVGDLPRTIELYADKAGPVTATAVREDGVTTVLNPDLGICTLDEDRPLRMELEIRQGRGWRPAEENKREDHPIGVIPVDCLFSPVERVRYDVQACRVGQRIDYDRLELEIWTDGRVSPQEALTRAAFLLREHLAIFGAAQEVVTPPPQVHVATAEEQALLGKLTLSVNVLELSVRAVNCLNTAQIRVLGELVEKNEGEMLKYRNFGKKSLQEIKAKLAEHGLALGMTLSDQVREAMKQKLATENKEE